MKLTNAEKLRLAGECRLQKSYPSYNKIMELHKEAVKEEKSFYSDPQTGLTVFTAIYLYKKEACCGSGCRHCPF